MRSDFFLGVDLGQRRDPSAIAIIERAEVIAERPDPIYWQRAKTTRMEVRHLERIRLGTPYTVVIQRILRMARAVSRLGSCTIAVDATGVGAPVVDALQIPGETYRLMPVMIGAADREYHVDGVWRVPKRDLIAGLQLAFDAGSFTIARSLRESEVLVEELTAMRAMTRRSGHTQLASPGSKHDDLAIALSLAWWATQTRRPGTLGSPNPLL